MSHRHSLIHADHGAGTVKRHREGMCRSKNVLDKKAVRQAVFRDPSSYGFAAERVHWTRLENAISSGPDFCTVRMMGWYLFGSPKVSITVSQDFPGVMNARASSAWAAGSKLA